MKDLILSLIGILIWGCYLFINLASADYPKGKDSEYATIMQTATPYDPKSNIQMDVALVAAAESLESIQDIPRRVNSWRGHGARVFGFASVARVYDYYMKGGWKDLDGNIDGETHEGEIQRNRYGGKFGPHQYMMMPSMQIIEHKKLWAKGFIDTRTEGMFYEEPDIFMDAGHSESFKKEWKSFYGAPWSPPHSSIENRIKSERLKAYIGHRSYKILSEYCKAYGGKNYKFGLAVHSLPNYMLWGVTFDYFGTLALPTIDILDAQVWTGTAKTRILYEGKMVERMLDNAYIDYSYCANLASALDKEIWFNLDPFEDEPGHSLEFYKRGFENTLVASLMHPEVSKWMVVPWPSRVYLNDCIPPLYGTEIQNILTVMEEIARDKDSYNWNKRLPRTGLLFSDSVLFEVRDPSPSNPQALYALSLPLLTMGLPVEIVPLEAVTNKEYINQFKILLLSYDFYKPMRAEYNQALAEWVKQTGGTLIIIGGQSAYNEAPLWWCRQGYFSPTAHLLDFLGIGSKKTQLVMQKKQDIRMLPSLENKSLANALGNFWNELMGADFVPRPMEFLTNDTFPDSNYLYEHVAPGHVIRDFRFPDGKVADLRYADGTGYFMYMFRTHGLNGLKVYTDITHNYIVEASADRMNWTELANSLKPLNKEVRDESNRRVLGFDLTPWIKRGAERIYLRFRDPSSSDGWGPLTYSMRLDPVYRKGYAPPTVETIPLNTRDAYVAAYSSIGTDIHPVTVGKNNAPIIFTKRLGHGEVIICGFSAILPGRSPEYAEMLRALYREVCHRRDEKFDEDGILHLTRARYHIVFPFKQNAQLKGRYINILSPELEVVNNPAIPRGKAVILAEFRSYPSEKLPALVFASHRVKSINWKSGHLKIIIEGPERIPAVARLLTPDVDKVNIKVRRLRDNTPVEYQHSFDKDSKTLLLVFNNYEGGVELTGTLKTEKKM